MLSDQRYVCCPVESRLEDSGTGCRGTGCRRPVIAGDAGYRGAGGAEHPVGRVGTREDVAALVEFLLSPDAGFITGKTLVVDGGMTRKMIYAE